MRFIKNTLWPVVVGVIGLFVFFIVMNLSYELLLALASVPIINVIFLLNVSILGVDVISIESFTFGAIAAMLLMALLTKYDKYGEGHCYAKASRTCAVFYSIYLALTIYLMFTNFGFSLALASNLIPYLLFAFFLFSGSKFE